MLKQILISSFLLLACISAVGESIYPVPLVSDPPPAVDGSGSRMSIVPGAIMLDDASQVVFCSNKWGGINDCSAEVTTGYDANYFYIFAKIKDDIVVQPHKGKDIFLGDHIMVIFDLPVQKGDTPNPAELFKIGFSPGNFADIQPEAMVWSPLGSTSEGIRTGAIKTRDGYQIEGAIPWELFGLKNVKDNLSMRLDIYIGDSDSDGQKTMLSLSGKMTLKQPALLKNAITTGTSGKVDIISNSESGKIIPLTNGAITINQKETVEITIPDNTAKNMRELVINAVMQFDKYAGGTYALQIELNGMSLNQSRILNRGESIAFAKHDLATCGTLDLWYTFYGPNFNPSTYPDVFSEGNKIYPAEFRFAVGDLMKPTNNILRIGNKAISKTNASLKVSVSGSDREVKIPDSDINGNLDDFVPATKLTAPLYTAKINGNGGIAVTLNKQDWMVSSEFSTLTPAWAVLGNNETNKEWTTLTIKGNTVSAKTKDFAIQRNVTLLPNKIRVIDHITNSTGDSLPLMYRHRFTISDFKDLYVCGRRVTARSKNSAPSYHNESGEVPTTLAVYQASALGLVGEDDFTRAQGFNAIDKNLAVTGNYRLVIPAKQSIDLEFSVYPLERADNFLFINRIRDDWGTNFTINGSGALMSADYNLKKGAGFVGENLKNKSAKYAMMSGFYRPQTGTDGKPISVARHGNGIMENDLTFLKENSALLEKACPLGIRLIYYHCFISNGKNDKTLFAQDTLREKNGQQANYDKVNYPLFMPRLGSAFAKKSEELINLRFAMGYQGIFWDELDYSMTKYDYNETNWDGVTAEISPITHRITRKMSNVTLATQSWRSAMVQMLLAKSKEHSFVANGAPITRTMSMFHFPRFIETGAMTNLVLGQLYTPIALGDHLTEKNEVDCYRNMVKALDFGGLYYWYYYTITATHPTLTDAMYPITPIALGRGYIIGDERILTNKSGYFGWNDNSTFNVRVFDRKGVETKDLKISIITRNGKNFAEVRIPKGYSASLIRKKP